MKNITLEEIIKRKIAFIEGHPDKELRDVDQGYLLGFKEMLSDMEMSETEFAEKYKKAIGNHNQQIDSVFAGDLKIPDFGKVSGYNNAVLEILSLLDTKYMFE